MSTDVLKWLIAGFITLFIAGAGITIPKIFSIFKTKYGTDKFDAFKAFAQYAAKNVVTWFKSNKGAEITAKEVYNAFVSTITTLIPVITSAQINSLFYNVIEDIAKELGIDLSEFSTIKLGLDKVNTEKPLFGDSKSKIKPLF